MTKQCAKDMFSKDMVCSSAFDTSKMNSGSPATRLDIARCVLLLCCAVESFHDSALVACAL